MGDVTKDLATLQARLAAVTKQMAEFQAIQTSQGNSVGAARNYQQQMQALSQLRNGVAGVTAGFNDSIRASGQYSAETVRTISKTQALTKAISEQKMTLGSAVRNWKSFNDVYREQVALSRASVVEWGSTSKTGKSAMDLYLPTGLNQELKDARIKYGLINQAIGAIGTQTVNWGKNMQWAGRQITVGIGVPLAIVAGAMGALAYKSDEQLTRLAKVYDTTVDASLSAQDQQLAKTQQLSDVRESAMSTATRMAQLYGASLSDTLGLEADLAAVGYKGVELQKTVAQVTRISTLGEIDRQTALDMTITLMSAYKQSADELTDTFNYMNAIENATSLSTEDFAEALPRAGGALANLGVDVQDFGVLLVALKEGGVNAAEGANALKSATTRLLRPTEAAKNAFSGMGINLAQVTAETKGNLLETLGILGERMQGFDNIQRQSAIAALFGTYQFNRLNVALDNIGQAYAGVGGEASQTAKAMEIAAAGGSSWAATAAQEIQTWQQSVSGRFKRAIETIKVEMAKLGAPVMAALAPVIEGVAKLFEWINGLPEGVKKWGFIAAAILGFAGPIIMLVGLFGNLFGNALKFGSTLGQLVTRFKIMTPEQKAAELSAKRAGTAFNTEMAQAEQLRLELTRLTNTMTAMNKQQMLNAGYRVTTNNRGGYGAYDPQGNRIPKEDAIRMGLIADSARQTEQATAQTRRNMGQWVGAAAGLGVSVLAFSTMVGSSHSIMENMMGIALIASSINFSGLGAGIASLAARGGGGIVGVFKGIGSSIKNLATTAATKLGGVGTRVAAGFAGAFAGVSKVQGVMNLLTSSAMRLFGPVGLLAAGAAAAYLIYQNMTDVQRAQEQINASTKTWAELLGYVEDVQEIQVNSGGTDSIAANAAAVNQLSSANQDLVDSLKEAKKAGGDFGKVYNLALQEALKVKLSGGTVDQARQAFSISLQAAGLDAIQMQDLLVKFDEVDLSNPKQLVDSILSQIDSAFQEGTSGGGFTPTGVGGWIQTHFFGGDVTDEGRAAGMRVGQMFALGLADAQANGDTQGALDLTSGLVNSINSSFQTQFGELEGNNKELFAQWGITTADELYEAIQTANQAFENNGFDYTGLSDKNVQLLTTLSSETSQFADTYGEQMDVIYHAIGQTLGQSEADIQSWIDQGVSYEQLMSILTNGLISVTDAQDLYERSITGAGREYNNYTDQQKLDILNQYRIRAGLSATNNLLDGFSDVTGDAADSARLLRGELTSLANIDLSNLNADQMTSYTKNMYSGAQSDVLSGAADLAKKQIDAENNAIQRQGDRRQASLDARGKAQDKAFDAQSKSLKKAQDQESKIFDKAWDARIDAADAYFDNESDRLDAEIDAVKAAADARVDAINAEIDALDAADDERDKLFEREKQRIERLADLRNGNIDFNTALSTGKLDEAAKIMNTQSSKVQQWSLDDQQSALGDASDARKKQLKGEIDQIKAVSDAQTEALKVRKDALKEAKEFRIAQLKEEREAEQEALKERQEAATEELASRKQAASEALAASKAAATADTQNRIANNNAQYASRQTTLDQELAAIRASTPRNQAEYDKQITQIQAAYARYGVDLQAQGTAWSGIIGGSLTAAVRTSSAQLVDQIAWQEYGAAIAARIESGAKISMQDLTAYLRTGKWPNATASAFSGFWAAIGNMANGSVFGVKHSGGLAGSSSSPTWSQADRVGVPRSAGLYPTEIPTILKQGEFVVNANSARRNIGLLTHINSKGALPGLKEIGDGGWAAAVPQPVFRHAGGMMNSVGAAFGLTYGTALESAVMQAMVMKGFTTAGGVDGAAGAYNGPTGGNVNNVLSVARAQQGKPYIWGGAGASGSDCSGFMSIIQNAVYGKQPPYGRRWATASFSGGKEIDGWKRGGSSTDVFRIGVEPGSHTAGTFAGINVESGSGHGPMVGGRALGANDKSFSYRYYLPAANQLPGLRTGGNILFDNTLANLHKGETVLTAPLTQAFQDNVASGAGNEYNVKVEFHGPVNSEIDVERAIEKAMDKAANKNGRKRVISN